MYDMICKNNTDSTPLPPQTVFSPYVVDETGFSEDNFWETYMQVKRSTATNRNLDGFEQYQRFIDRLRALVDIQLVPLKDILSVRNDSMKIIALRFDIDIEPLAALRLARHNARCGIPSTFFLLHIAYYYGVLQQKIFHRNPLLKDWLRSLIVSGCEIGLHTDALSCYLAYGVDGAMAIVEEIAWLRSQGAIITGTAAHNSYPAYHAENFEIFNNHVLGGRSEGSINGNRYPLGVLDEAELGLSYEANYPIPRKGLIDNMTNSKVMKWCSSTNSDSVESERWMHTYLFDNPCYGRGFEATIWHHGGDRWTIATKVNRLFRRRWYWKVDGQQMFQVLERLPGGVRVVFLLHPIYFSRDTTRSLLDS